MVRALPHPPRGRGIRRLRLAVLNASGLAPGMNAVVRAAVRLALDRGHYVLGVRNSFHGPVVYNDLFEFDWMAVNGWARLGGSELGTNRPVGSQRLLRHRPHHRGAQD